MKKKQYFDYIMSFYFKKCKNETKKIVQVMKKLLWDWICHMLEILPWIMHCNQVDQLKSTGSIWIVKNYQLYAMLEIANILKIS